MYNYGTFYTDYSNTAVAKMHPDRENSWTLMAYVHNNRDSENDFIHVYDFFNMREVNRSYEVDFLWNDIVETKKYNVGSSGDKMWTF